jgi:hypothetical protein
LRERIQACARSACQNNAFVFHYVCSRYVTIYGNNVVIPAKAGTYPRIAPMLVP